MEPFRVDVRILCATNRDLRDMVANEESGSNLRCKQLPSCLGTVKLGLFSAGRAVLTEDPSADSSQPPEVSSERFYF